MKALSHGQLMLLKELPDPPQEEGLRCTYTRRYQAFELVERGLARRMDTTPGAWFVRTAEGRKRALGESFTQITEDQPRPRFSVTRRQEIEHDLHEWEEVRQLLAELDGCSAEADAAQVARARMTLERLIPTVRELLRRPSAYVYVTADGHPHPERGPLTICALRASDDGDGDRLQLHGSALLTVGVSFEPECAVKLMLEPEVAEELQQTLQRELIEAARECRGEELVGICLVGELNVEGRDMRERRERLRSRK